MSFPKYTLFTLFAVGVFYISSFSAYGKGFKVISFVEDKIVKFHGHIYDSISSNPDIAAVGAKLIIKSLPHGSEIGIISSIDSSGYFEYYVNVAYNYEIEIQSSNHRWQFESLKPAEILKNDEVSRDYYLIPQVKENQVIRLNKLIFEQGKSNITSESYGELNSLVKMMTDNTAMQIQLEGHTDYRGSKKLNMELSQDRVDAVKEYLIGKGVNSRKIKTKAFGGTKPLNKGKSLKASEINRRVEVRILKLK